MWNFFLRYWILLIPGLSIFFVSHIYIKAFGSDIVVPENVADGYAAFGQFGDYFGGMLNPILAFINIAIIAYFQQKYVAKSAEKDVLFRMIDLHSRIVEGIELQSNQLSTTGQRAFWIFDSEIKERYKKGLDYRYPQGGASIEQKRDVLIKAYSSYFHSSYKKQYLGHYFRNLYLIFKTIHTSDVFSEKEKMHFAKIVRAQLSHIEQKFLYLNCNIAAGFAFKKYVHEYDLLEWIGDKDFDNCDTAFCNSDVISNDIKSWGKKK